MSFTWLTPPAPAAIAVVRLAREAIPATWSAPAADSACFTVLRDQDGSAIDEVVLIGAADFVDCCCHGGPGVRAAVDAALRAQGLRPAPVTDDRWTQLAAAPSRAAATWLLAHPGEAPPFREEFLRRSPIILITGPPNAGKSTLLNVWCGHQRALVSDLPGTTRDLVAAETELAGWRVQLLDSAGLRESADMLEAAGIALAHQARAAADCVLYLAASDEAAAAPADVDLAVQGKIDLAAAEPDGLVWSAPAFVGESRSQELLAQLEVAILTHLGLPPDGRDARP